jgi:CRP/FNR family cyclic AMP-dependent transcriptional regulator
MPPAAARSAAIAAGWAFYEQNQALFAQARRCRFDFIRFSEIEARRRADFETHFATFQGIFDRDRAFRQTVESFGRLYLGRQAEEDGGLSREEAWVRQQMATLYLLEELAIFAILQEIGPFVYPGSIKSIQDLAGGRFPEAPLQELIFISLRLNRGGAYFADRAVRQLKPRPAANHHDPLDLVTLADWPILEGYVRPVKFRAGQDIIAYGQTDTTLYILTEGEAEVILPNADRSIKQVIDRLEAGTVCGEQAFLDGQPRSAGVRAVTDGQAYLLERPEFDRLQAEHPQVAVTVLLDLVGRTLTGRQRAHSWESQQRIGG